MNCASLVYKVEAKLGNNLIEVHLCDTFLYYLFTYDDVSTFEWSTMILEDKGANRVNKGVLDPCSWISFPFDPGNELNCGICLVMLGQDDKNNLEKFVGTFPYDGKFFLRVYNLLEGPTLCMGKGRFLTPFLYYLFAYDLVDCASYGDKSYLSREGEVYLKFIMLSLCVPSCDVMSARILKPSCNLAYRNTLDDPYVHDDESHICLKWALHFGRGLDSRTNPFQEGEDDNNMDSMDRVKALEELDGHKIKKYNVWKVHLSEEKEERGHLCKWSSHNFKNSQKKTTKQGPYLIKDEEESYKLNNTTHVLTRELIEIRDIYPPPKIDLENPWHIKLNITHDEVVVRKLVIPFVETFEYILLYWTLDMAKSVENGYGMPVDMWDVTKENVPKKYEGGSVCLRNL
ncbi:hypothetical protein MTR67_023839 [Solanum verrucosum]|uniref:Uncharacterized protein n=1 Tax=Solanum verrucosum TaxID=315347 RepID=A0AAF0R2Q0_SOLVR|nr:hypothetical protein MTR67_023839 [Solanum verrucosum]